MANGLLLPPSSHLRHMLVRQVQDVFNDRDRGEKPVVRSDNALYPPQSVIWRVHGDVTTMMIGGVTALLLQMLHPAALAGVWDHSGFRRDMVGRLRRTARFIAVTTFGDRADAEAVIDRVRRVHGHVKGALPDGTRYAANDPRLLAWVHVCEAMAFLDAWIAFAEPGMSGADQDSYFAQAAQVARALGADTVPESRVEAEALITSFLPELRVDARTRDVARMILSQPAPSTAMKPAQALLMQAAVDILPFWAKRLHGFQIRPLASPLIRGGAFTIAHMLRWAFRQNRQFRSTI
ncbi:hypothetical protein CAF53_19245 [Sphingobium sp. LB126]|uniref:oxygenase MpaB family protein n=1 Tax=Sphingobium sp. LB126 TaxID=1983755 RepID=UPI000C20330C|nr:oxygenase MpaB family protein [Sphingobium sp. LB126]PJG46330.1 hypothetical protein CAF53_19245 [Sphingobium sp. LB126]